MMVAEMLRYDANLLTLIQNVQRLCRYIVGTERVICRVWEMVPLTVESQVWAHLGVNRCGGVLVSRIGLTGGSRHLV